MLLLLALSCESPAPALTRDGELTWSAEPNWERRHAEAIATEAPGTADDSPEDTASRGVNEDVELCWFFATQALRVELALGCTTPGSCEGAAGVADATREWWLALGDQTLEDSVGEEVR